MGQLSNMDSQESRRLASTLEQLASQGADKAQITAAIVFAWSEIETALAPIIGKRGVAALYERGLYLTSSNHPWLAAVPAGADGRMDLPALTAVLEKQGSAAAAAGGGAHLQAVYELLSSLIGPSLTERLLRSIWANSFNGPASQDLLP
jgi:hypothetical protein